MAPAAALYVQPRLLLQEDPCSSLRFSPRAHQRRPFNSKEGDDVPTYTRYLLKPPSDCMTLDL